MRSKEELRSATDPQRVHIAGAVRRMAITATTKVLWKLLGYLLPDGTRETPEAEPFTGIGFYARPPATGKPEAIVVMVGEGGRNPMIIAVRDEKTRAAIVGALAADESAMFTSQSVVIIKASGVIEARSANGSAEPLALQSALETLRDHVASLPVGGTGSAPVACPSVGSGTTVLKGE